MRYIKLYYDILSITSYEWSILNLERLKSLENITFLHKMGKKSFLGTLGMLSPRHPINTFDKLCAVKYTTRFSHPSAVLTEEWSSESFNEASASSCTICFFVRHKLCRVYREENSFSLRSRCFQHENGRCVLLKFWIYWKRWLQVNSDYHRPN